VGWGVWVDVVAVAVDGNMVVVPAKCGEVVRMVAAAICEPGDVVGLEAVVAYTSVYDTSPVAMGDCVSDGWWDAAGGW
jgi:hypothetical protein